MTPRRHGRRWIGFVIGLIALGGCGSSTRTSSANRAGSGEAIGPLARAQLDDCAERYVDALERWQKKRKLPPLRIHTPQVVLDKNTPLHELYRLAGALSRAINDQESARVSIVPVNEVPPGPTPFGPEFSASENAEVFDSRLYLERIPAGAGRANRRLTLELIDPLRGKSAFEVLYAFRDRGAVPARGKTREGLALSGATLEPTAPRPDQTKSAPPPTRSGTRSLPASSVEFREPGGPEANGKHARASSGESPAKRSKGGEILIVDKKLRDRLVVLQEHVSSRDRRLRVRFMFTSREKTLRLKLSINFYDEYGFGAGTLRKAKLKVRQGRTAAFVAISERPAVRYVLFIDD